MATTIWPTKKDRLVKMPSTIKPMRSLTHPVPRPPTNAPKKQQVKHGEPFDPEELSRRLQTHLTNQKLRAEQRSGPKPPKVTKVTKAPAEVSPGENDPLLLPKNSSPGQENVYRHVPQTAAAAFARTATADPMRQVHRLSQPVLRTRMDHLTFEEPAGKPLRKTQAMEQAIAEREMLRNRNPFQRSQAMEDAAEVDIYRDVYKPQRRSFRNDSSYLWPGQDSNSQRRVSTGDMLDSNEPLMGTTTKMRQGARPNGLDMSERNNWAQQDEPGESKSAKKEKDPLVRRKSSSWILLGKSPKPDKEQDELAPGLLETGSPTDGGRKMSFLSRFKRHPS